MELASRGLAKLRLRSLRVDQREDVGRLRVTPPAEHPDKRFECGGVQLANGGSPFVDQSSQQLVQKVVQLGHVQKATTLLLRSTLAGDRRIEAVLPRTVPAVVRGLAVSMILLTATACAAPSESATAQVGKPAPEFSLTQLDGGQTTLASQRGRVVLLNFWATWCAPCKKEMPALQSVADRLANQPFSLLAVNLQETPDMVRPFEQDLKLRFPILLDTEGDVARRYNVRALPATFLVDPQGVLAEQRLGPLLETDDGSPWSTSWLLERIQALASG